MSASKLRENARQSLKEKWGKGALIILSYLVIMFIISWVLGIIPIIGPIVSAIISVPISYGIMVSFMKLKRGEEVKCTGFLKEGFSKFSKVWGVFGHTILKMIVPIILIIISYLIIIGVSTGYLIFGMSNEVATATSFLGLMMLGIILLIISVIYGAAKGLLYSLTNYILYDNPDMDSKAIVAESERLMKGNRLKYIWLEITFIGWMILALFTLGIGLLWLIPYIATAVICFYEALAGKTSNAEVEVIEEDNNPISE